MLIRSNPLHQSVYITSANSVSATVYEWSSYVTSFFNLRENNDDLNRRNAALERELYATRQQVALLQEKLLADSIPPLDSLIQYNFIVAHVINNSVVRPHNYLTINKGSADGVLPDMGVIDQNGVVGIVNVTGKHSARVISLLNSYFRLSCKIKNDNSFGSLVWDGDDPRYAVLEELPRHSRFNIGDTIVTSGYSAVFPPGLPVGIVDSHAGSPNDNFYSLRIRLLSDFSTLNNVQVVVNYMADELRALEQPEKALEDKEKP